MFCDLINIIFPTYCLACKVVLVKGERWLCSKCFIDLPQNNYKLDINNSLVQRFYGRIPITYAIALYKFRAGNTVQRLVHHFKYGNTPEIGEMLGKICAAQLLKEDFQHKFDCILPVPLHVNKLRQRGYNQSNYFAQGIASLLEIPWYDRCLQRVKNTNTQTQRNRIERLDNLLGAFYVQSPTLIQNKHILLVDDIVTTGATLEACALSLLSAKVKEISIAAIAVVD